MKILAFLVFSTLAMCQSQVVVPEEKVAETVVPGTVEAWSERNWSLSTYGKPIVVPVKITVGGYIVGNEKDDVYIRIISDEDAKKLADAEKAAVLAREQLEAVKRSIRQKYGDSTFSGVRNAICGQVDRVVDIKGRFAIVTKRVANDCPIMVLTN